MLVFNLHNKFRFSLDIDKAGFSSDCFMTMQIEGVNLFNCIKFVKPSKCSPIYVLNDDNKSSV